MASFGSRPGGLSILITSAPKSARMRVQVGPARTRVRSRTRRCARAIDGAGRGMGLSLPYSIVAGKLLRSEWSPACCGRFVAEAAFGMHGEGHRGAEQKKRH